MKRRQMLVISLLAAALMGCDRESDASARRQSSKDAAAQLDKAKGKSREAVEAVKDFAYAQRVEYAEAIRAELVELNAELDVLSAKAESAQSSVRADAQARVREIRVKIVNLNERLDAMKDATESTWDETKAGVRKANDDLRRSFQEARQWWSEKIAP